jgi:hypothetical protein
MLQKQYYDSRRASPCSDAPGRREGARYRAHCSGAAAAGAGARAARPASSEVSITILAW